MLFLFNFFIILFFVLFFILRQWFILSHSKLNCPQCGSSLSRIKRLKNDHILSKLLILSLGRYQCHNYKCRWHGLRNYSSYDKQNLKLEKNRIKNKYTNKLIQKSPTVPIIVSDEPKYLNYHSIADIYYAFKNNEFALFYQPKINIVNHEITGVEVLLRWRHPEKGFVSPLTFLSQSEIKKIILLIGKFSFQKGFKELKNWHQMGLFPLSLSINLSSDQFYHPELKNYICSSLERSILSPEFIELEISQEILLNNLTAAKEVINYLKTLNIKIYIDNFNLDDLIFKQYSFQELFSSLPVQGIKIDPYFVRNLSLDLCNYKDFQLLLSMARNLEIDAVAQGVETRYQLDLLRSLGCYVMQGHLFDPALPVEDITDVLKANWFGRSHGMGGTVWTPRTRD